MEQTVKGDFRVENFRIGPEGSDSKDIKIPLVVSPNDFLGSDTFKVTAVFSTGFKELRSELPLPDFLDETFNVILIDPPVANGESSFIKYQHFIQEAFLIPFQFDAIVFKAFAQYKGFHDALS